MKILSNVKRFMETETGITNKDRLTACGSILLLTGIAMVLNYKNCTLKIDNCFQEEEIKHLKGIVDEQVKLNEALCKNNMEDSVEEFND